MSYWLGNINISFAASQLSFLQNIPTGIFMFSPLFQWNANSRTLEVIRWPMSLRFFSDLFWRVLIYSFAVPPLSPPNIIPSRFFHPSSHVSSAHCRFDDWWWGTLLLLTSSTSEKVFKSQSSLTVFEKRNETVSLTQRLLAWGKNSFWNRGKKAPTLSTPQTTLFHIHLTTTLSSHPFAFHICFQRP